jgi:uncharacterized protein (TIGR02271 family)
MDKQVIVVDKDNIRGTVISPSGEIEAVPQVLVQFDNDQQVWISTDSLTKMRDNSYYLPVSLSEMRDEFTEARESERLVIPVVEETAKLSKRVVQKSKVQIKKVVEEKHEAFDLPLLEEYVEVKRVPVNRTFDKPVPVRSEGDTLIIPVHKEVLIIQKKFLVSEEIHVIKQQTERIHTEEVSLLQEKVVVNRLENHP